VLPVDRRLLLGHREPEDRREERPPRLPGLRVGEGGAQQVRVGERVEDRHEGVVVEVAVMVVTDVEKAPGAAHPGGARGQAGGS
jgi:hypothetical protein